MIITTTAGTVEVWAQTNTSLGRVVLASGNVEMLESVTASIELAGTSEDVRDTGTIDKYVFDSETEKWTLELDRTTFKIWLCFEVEHYLVYGKGEM